MEIVVNVLNTLHLNEVKELNGNEGGGGGDK